jgi:hypothetical protein
MAAADQKRLLFSNKIALIHIFWDILCKSSLGKQFAMNAASDNGGLKLIQDSILL